MQTQESLATQYLKIHRLCGKNAKIMPELKKFRDRLRKRLRRRERNALR